jgi:hypothetical protein
MLNHNQDGSSTGLVVSVVCLSILSIGVIIFAVWAYGGKQDYKNNVDTKVNTAVTSAVGKQQSIDSAKYAQASKYPLSTYDGPEAYGSIVMQYPKTWSAYLNSYTDTNGGNSSTNVVDAYFNPSIVPSVSNAASIYAVRLQVLNQSYSQSLQTLQQAQGVTSVAYTLPKLPNIVGVEATGPINGQNQPSETMVVLPIRSETIELWTDGTQYLSDFNNVILPNFSFSP